ncbi:MAG: hypothetical protein BWX50_01146 [Euryarchaeota archaeon ADurb.Bin009]|nr:MAG: hypothetical protein BWX50_01146 [Euryarchaeota archaeon ADurb.Bin009]
MSASMMMVAEPVCSKMLWYMSLDRCTSASACLCLIPWRIMFRSSANRAEGLSPFRR